MVVITWCTNLTLLCKFVWGGGRGEEGMGGGGDNYIYHFRKRPKYNSEHLTFWWGIVQLLGWGGEEINFVAGGVSLL